MSTTMSAQARIDDHEREQIERANASGRAPIVRCVPSAARRIIVAVATRQLRERGRARCAW